MHHGSMSKHGRDERDVDEDMDSDSDDKGRFRARNLRRSGASSHSARIQATSHKRSDNPSRERERQRWVEKYHDRQDGRDTEMAHSTDDKNNRYELQRDGKRAHTDAFSGPDADCASSSQDLRLDRRSRSPSPARDRNGSLPSRNVRSSSNALDRRDYILDLADHERTPSDGAESRRQQKHPATFPCTLCPKRFTRAYNLRSHLLTHGDERPFVCAVCGKAYARQYDRKRHEGLHSVCRPRSACSQSASTSTPPEKTTSDVGNDEIVADHSDRSEGGSKEVKIWQTARATSAAVNYFEGLTDLCHGSSSNSSVENQSRGPSPSPKKGVSRAVWVPKKTIDELEELGDVTGDVTAVQALLNRWLNGSASTLLLKDDETVT